MKRPELDPRFTAAVDMLGRTGMQTFRIGFSDPEEGEPVVWYAVGQWLRNSEAAGAVDPLTAVLRLCELVIDGGECAHCHRPTIFALDMNTSLLDMVGCVYAFDPELATYRRGCEGDT
jgi:hypothetical protein